MFPEKPLPRCRLSEI
ncbi:unnamed protein product [Victoria cruziana]